MQRLFCLTLIFCGVACDAVSGPILYSNIGPGYPGDAVAGIATNAAVFGTTFTAVGSGTLGAVLFSLSSAAPGNPVVTASLYSNSGAQPGPLLESWVYTYALGFSVQNLASIAHPTIVAGNSYWFLLQLNPSVPSTLDWDGNDTGVTGGLWAGNTLTSLFNSFNSLAAPGIQLTGVAAVPEPASGVLLGLAGVIVLCEVARRKIKESSPASLTDLRRPRR